MIKLLIKKELKALFSQYITRGKSNKKKSKSQTLGFVILFVFLFITLMAAFFATAVSMAESLIKVNMGWFYFATMGIMALALGIFGEIFNTYSLLYKAKDNEQLLSLPIPPRAILISRMVVVSIMGAAFELMVFLPTIIAYWIYAPKMALSFVVLRVFFQILLFLSLSLVITTLSCLLGWLIAVISNHIKHKNIVIILCSLGFFALYYYFVLGLNNFITSLITNVEQISATLRSGFYPVYAFGLGAEGSTLHALGFAFFSLVIFTLTLFVLTKSFTKITSSSSNVEKKAYKGYRGHRDSQYMALIKREGKRFISLPTYTLNAGLGVVVMPILLVLILVKLSAVKGLIANFNTMGYGFIIPLVFASGIASIVSLDCGTAPSVSLEGNTLWIVKSIPIDASLVLKAKVDFFFLINAIPALLLALGGSIALGFSTINILFITIYSIAFTYFISSFGLLMGIKNVNLNWTNPVIPIKQSIAVMITLFGGWIMTIIMPVGCFFLRNIISENLWFAINIFVVILLDIFLLLWRNKKGVKRFMEL